MTRVHLLTRTFDSPNTYSFLFPLLRYRDALEREGLTFQRFREPREELFSCDVLALDGRLITTTEGWQQDREKLLDRVETWRNQVEELVWIDTTASTGTLHTPVLDHVDRYLKGQLLRNRNRYSDPMYGGRPFTQYYNREYGIEDEDELVQRGLSAEERAKLEVAWNSGLAYYGRWRIELMKLHEWTRWDRLLAKPRRWTPPSQDRPEDISARFGAPYDRNTVRFQRERLLETLESHLNLDRIGKTAYFRELRRSKLALSPYGWGEKCYRDYETWLTGALLVKPDMDHVETWPDWYQQDAYLSLDWDVREPRKRMEHALDDYDRCIDRARNAYERYREHLVGPEGRARFVSRALDVFD